MPKQKTGPEVQVVAMGRDVHGLSHTRRGDEENARMSSAWFFKLASLWLHQIEFGELEFILPDGAKRRFKGRFPGPAAHLHVHSSKVLWQSLARGSLGFAESYLDGGWSSRSLEDLFSFFLKNRGVFSTKGPLFKRAAWADRLLHRLRRNSLAGSRKNIAAHYDLGNAFYRLWLDETMTYSSAIDVGARSSLAEAQSAKYSRALSLLGSAPGAKVLEIGCGWGGFAEHYLKHCDGGYHGITLSSEQLKYTHHRLSDRGLLSRGTLGLTDYRDMTGRFDHIVSIEMMEAVGEAYWPIYFSKIRDLLAPKGTAVLQVITIEKNAFRRYSQRPDFIQRYIFPGGMLPTKDHIGELALAAGLQLAHSEHFGKDYALTLRQWHARFENNWPQICRLGFDDRFRRMWRYYLTYCAAGFENGALDVGLYRLQKV